MRRRLISCLLVVVLFLLLATPVTAQSSYSFQVPTETVDAFWNSDGTLSLAYIFDFVNNPSGHVIDFIDLGLPNNNYSKSNIKVYVNGTQISPDWSSSFQGQGCCGVAVGLGKYAINSGASGKVEVDITNIRGVLNIDSSDPSYVSAVFDPSYFGSENVTGKTDLTMTFHLPPGIKTTEPRWHTSPDNFPAQPESGLDNEGRIVYIWENKSANAYTDYKFGASFPKSYVPAGVIVTPSPVPSNIGSPGSGIGSFLSGAILPILCIGGFIAIVVAGLSADSKRRLTYLPPKISIEGHGIKRGLTAVEAAILLEQPLDKVMTMILFSTIKKNSAEVVTRDPLEIKVTQPLPEGLQPYETDFLTAFQKTGVDRRKGLQTMVVNLVKNVSEKMKGFSRQETIAYYTNITKQAWAQVEAANTPEVKSQKYEEVMDWTMLDKNYGDRTEEVFRNMPVFIPVWWGRYDPGLGRAAGSAAPVSVGSAPRVGGTDFARSITTGVHTFSSKVVGSIQEFTSSITSVTNPAPKTSSGSFHGSGGGFGGGGHSCACACACACAGCACACAGGGR